MSRHQAGPVLEVRPARAGESSSFGRLIDLANVAVERGIPEAIECSVAANLLLQAAESENRRALQLAASRVVRSDQILPFFIQVSLPLLAVRADEGAVGALQGIVPGNIAAECLANGWPPPVIASLAVRVAKVAAVGVQPGSTRQGVGLAMLETACSIYFSAGYRLVYGYFNKQNEFGLDNFYQNAGFRLPSKAVTVGLAEGAIVDIGTDPHSDQQMFAMTLNAWRNQR